MTYQTSPDHFAAANPLASATRKTFSQVAAFFRAIGNSMIKASEASSRIQNIEALNEKSDAELAQMGLRRDQIVHYVFQDLYYC